MTDSIVSLFSDWAHQTPNAPAVIDGSGTISYRRLEIAMLRAADSFSAKGWGPGAVVGLASTGSSAALHLAIALALARIGAVQLLLSPDEMSSGEAGRLLERHHARAVLTDLSVAGDCRIPTLPLDRSILDPNGPAPLDVSIADGGDRPWLLGRSSGTTGKPKEFYFTHAMDLARYETRPDAVKLPPGEHTMTLVDFGFTMGLRWALRCLWDGGTLVASPKGASADQVIDEANRHRVASMVCTPRHLAFLLKGTTDNSPRLPLLRCLAITSAALTDAVFHEARRRITPNLFVIYGTNETWNISAATGDVVEEHPGTVGYLTEGVELDVVDPSGCEVPPETFGEIRVRTPGMIKSYIDNPEANSRHFRDGWFYPGDAGAMSRDGLLFLMGRTDEVINFDGMLIGPQDIESAILQYPGISEAAAFGVHLNDRGDVPFAAVVSEKPIDMDELLAHCRSRLGRRAPARIIQMESLPRSPIGKVLRRSLTQTALQRIRDGSLT